MKKYDDKMNYDENGLYPDEKPMSEIHPVASKILSTLIILIFIAGIGCLFFFGNAGNGYAAMYTFFGIFLGIGIIALISDVIVEERSPQVGIYIALGIGILGIAGTALVQQGSYNTRMTMLKLFFVSITGILAALGLIHSIRNAKYVLRSKDNCTQSVMAECVDRAIVTYTSGGTVKKGGTTTKVTFRPTYKFTFEDKEYKVTSGTTTSKRDKGMQYEIFVDPENPNVFYDPEAEKKGLFSVILTFILFVGIPVLICAIFIFAFKTAGI
ncbi:MAG: hypothetical protein K5898_05920 [Ruminococcus sp.]|uniref:DUF3592 domain-containing protein n=1 Tax=Ruminococcus sp. TaxID=41978 RepID=UPI0025DE7128|nr:hypothetical protein [Ruminococcus sp.]MCR4794693.1 hypothetical protein [Ruminococcus sp.]